MTMKKGDVALSTIAHEYALGSSGFQHELAVVSHNSTVYNEVELASFEKEKVILSPGHALSFIAVGGGIVT
ncbi:hypothetical protein Nepgr_027496 [Nepenthes gracilis]|uniref:Uncharacterized protein n=1 Tax=Nepenthes gracilis TaxID=150966 RepID=A0AAD3T8Y5_NEPGR|nr:hypothetical protein Nepgr_027496 [Nepenthes gracilis]